MVYSKILSSLKLWKGKIVIVTDSTVALLYAESFLLCLKEFKPDTLLVKIPVGESSKSREMKEFLEDNLIEHGVARSDLLVAFGGGVVSDVVGYLASTYLRGISYIVVPTTLMGMVDAAIGGKNGINHPKGKNLMGSLHTPLDVFIEPRFLDTLPDTVYREGFIEVIKYGLIFDKEFFECLENASLTKSAFIERCIQIKRYIVKSDPSDLGLRRILNYGHLVAHAIEKCSLYSVSHGRALWYGLLIENYISYLLGNLSIEEMDRVTVFLLREEIRFLPIPVLDPQVLYEAMKNDKKAANHIPRVVVLKRIGKVVSFGGEYCAPLAYEDFKKAFSWATSLIANPFAMRALTS